MSVDSWKSIFDTVAVVTALLAFFAGAGALWTGNILGKRQDEQLRQFDKDLTSAKIALAQQQERAAEADARVAGLEKDALNAKSVQQRVEIELTRQRERTANAERDALDASLALAKFKEPRTISPEQQEKFISALKPFVGQNFCFAVFPEPEPLALLRVLSELLKSARWNRIPSQIQRASGVLLEDASEPVAEIFDIGIDAYLAPDDIASEPAQVAFCGALIAAGIPCERHRTPQLAGKIPKAITISIGKKP